MIAVPEPQLNPERILSFSPRLSRRAGSYLGIPITIPSILRACLKILLGLATRDFGSGQGGESGLPAVASAKAGASPQRAVTDESTHAADKRSAEGPDSIFRPALIELRNG